MSKPSAGAMRAAEKISKIYGWPIVDADTTHNAHIIDQEIGLPELVEAAKWTLNIINGVSRSGGIVNPMDDEPEAAFDSLATAIAKAEGREGT